MQNIKEENFKNFCCDHKALSGLIGVLTLFLLILSISTAVGIVNKIREGKYIGQEIESKNTIVVDGRGEIYAKPDLAVTSFSVLTESKTVAGAMSENTKKMNAVIKAMKDAGISEKDLKTTNFYISPRYEYTRSDVPLSSVSSYYPESKRVLVGYDVSQSLQVKIRKMEDIGSIIQKATDAGANQASDLQFTIDNADDLKKQAREEAIKEAKAKAKEIAKELGISLVRIANFNESSQSPYYRYDYAMKGMGGGEVVPEAMPDIQTGENKIEVNVNITYEIN